ncbi:hypothetical protein [Bailinhaonella thermotolerans]|uniref:Uncharacterized protein n=1 Tax=Bailinhaonella thermotolerans TaxID=1070861 RepID=A0A3A4A712_9ACTN|nr:hypothetical protein [Bailinhaonella thermotolerans]RJL20672.1 hypothetical protein D5H75_39055 [Bailinhaonella thermotolerans]
MKIRTAAAALAIGAIAGSLFAAPAFADEDEGVMGIINSSEGFDVEIFEDEDNGKHDEEDKDGREHWQDAMDTSFDLDVFDRIR